MSHYKKFNSAQMADPSGIHSKSEVLNLSLEKTQKKGERFCSGTKIYSVRLLRVCRGIMVNKKPTSDPITCLTVTASINLYINSGVTALISLHISILGIVMWM